jgi:hypothetical protein
MPVHGFTEMESEQQQQNEVQLDRELILAAVKGALSSMRCPDAMRQRKLECARLAMPYDPYSVFRVQAILEYQRRNVSVMAKDEELHTIALSIVDEWWEMIVEKRKEAAEASESSSST